MLWPFRNLKLAFPCIPTRNVWWTCDGPRQRKMNWPQPRRGGCGAWLCESQQVRKRQGVGVNFNESVFGRTAAAELCHSRAPGTLNGIVAPAQGWREVPAFGCMAAELPEITGDKDLVQRIRENFDAPGNTFIWQRPLSF